MTELQSSPFELPSKDDHVIRGTMWRPDGEIRGLIQLFHGLGEHHLRYERFARAAAERGFALIAHDHRGHGQHAKELGYFADRDGWQALIDDGLCVNDMLQQQFSGTPIVLLGHSMGSFIAQAFAMFHDTRIAALALSASTWPNKISLFAGRLIAHIESWRLGPHAQSALLHKLGFGEFNRPFRPERTPLDWLSRDELEVDKYVADPLCGGPYSCRLWLDFLGGLSSIASDNAVQRIRSDLPILFCSGADDPVGGDKGVTKLAMHYAQTGHGRVRIKLYPEGRHEMLNETNRAEFSDDLLSWMEDQLPGGSNLFAPTRI